MADLAWVDWLIMLILIGGGIGAALCKIPKMHGDD